MAEKICPKCGHNDESKTNSVERRFKALLVGEWELRENESCLTVINKETQKSICVLVTGYHWERGGCFRREIMKQIGQYLIRLHAEAPTKERLEDE